MLHRSVLLLIRFYFYFLFIYLFFILFFLYLCGKLTTVLCILYNSVKYDRRMRKSFASSPRSSFATQKYDFISCKHVQTYGLPSLKTTCVQLSRFISYGHHTKNERQFRTGRTLIFHIIYKNNAVKNVVCFPKVHCHKWVRTAQSLQPLITG